MSIKIKLKNHKSEAHKANLLLGQLLDLLTNLNDTDEVKVKALWQVAEIANDTAKMVQQDSNLTNQ